MTAAAEQSLVVVPRWHFLVYAPRSGSTIFAKTLAEHCPRLLVVPEFRTVEFLLARSEGSVHKLTPRALARLLLADRQLLPNLGIGPEVARRIAVESTGRSTSEILAAVVSAYTGAPLPPDVVLKLSTAAEFPTRLREISPHASIIHVYRDGRAAVSSMLMTRRVYFKNETMGRGDVVHACRVWARHQRTMSRLSIAGDQVIPVRYETFVEQPERACSEVVALLRPDPAPPSTHPAFAVSEREAQLHREVAGPPTTTRRDAWMSDMPRPALVFADWRLRGELTALGYDEPIQPRPHRRELASALAAAYASHLKVSVAYFTKRVITHALQPAVVITHVQARCAIVMQRRRSAS